MKENAFKGESAVQNPLASLPVKSLMLKMGIPMILSMALQAVILFRRQGFHVRKVFGIHILSFKHF